MLVSTRLTEIEAMLEAIESLANTNISPSQLAKLYGYVEQFQIQEVDTIDVADESQRSRRRECAKKTNKVLDSLSQETRE